MGAIKNGTMIPTPTGNIPIENLKVNDYVFGRSGLPVKILSTSTYKISTAYKLYFRDHRSIITSEDQIWSIRNKSANHIITTSLNMFSKGVQNGIKKKYYKYRILNNKLVHFSSQLPLPVDPYVLGVLLADGKTGQTEVTISSTDKYVIDKCSTLMPRENIPHCWGNTNSWYFKLRTPYHSDSNRLVSNYQLKDLLKDQIVLHKHSENFIPEIYLTSSLEDRLALTQGLMDANGSVFDRGSVVLQNSSKQLALDFLTLIRSLGYSAYLLTHKFSDKQTHVLNYLVIITRRSDRTKLFTLPRKLNKLKDYEEKHKQRILPFIPIIKIQRYNQPTKVTSLIVNSDDHMFLANDFLPIHDATASYKKGVF